MRWRDTVLRGLAIIVSASLAKEVIGSGRPLWWWLVAGLAFGVVGLPITIWWRRHLRRVAVLEGRMPSPFPPPDISSVSRPWG